jgi:hypothetical protein
MFTFIKSLALLDSNLFPKFQGHWDGGPNWFRLNIMVTTFSSTMLSPICSNNWNTSRSWTCLVQSNMAFRIHQHNFFSKISYHLIVQLELWWSFMSHWWNDTFKHKLSVNSLWKKGCFVIGLVIQFLSYKRHLQLTIFIHREF